VRSINEGGEELFDLLSLVELDVEVAEDYELHRIERMNAELRRRVKTHGSLPNSEAGLKLLTI
jgi:transposase-like protein